MVHKPPRERRRQARLADIRNHALALVEADGLDGLTMQRLAQRLDLSVGALYRYHPSKDALVAHLQADILDDWAVSLARVEARCHALAEPQPDVAALLPVLAAVALYAELPTAEPGPFALMSRILGDPRPLVDDRVAAQVVLPAMTRLLGRVAASLDAAVGPALDPGPAHSRSLTLFGAVHGLVQLRKLQRLAPASLPLAGRPTQGLAFAMAGDLLRAWGATPAAVHAAGLRLAPLAPLLHPPAPFQPEQT